MRPALCFLVLIAAALPARAALNWTQKTMTLKADPDASVVEARFHFTNAGAKALDVQQVESSCGCTTAELEKRHYEPGESGDIIARFTVGVRVGRQTKTIAVKTNDQPEPETLTLIVDIPELVRIRPTFVYWVEGQAPAPKTMTLEIQPDSPVDKITVQCSNPAMTPAIKEIVKGLRYELVVTPSRTDKITFCMLNLDCTFVGKEGTKTFRTYATVKPTGSDPQ